MSLLGELILRALWKSKCRLARAKNVDKHQGDHSSQIRWQYSSSAQLFGCYPNWEPKARTILDIGCGTGGRTAWLATTGATRVVGIDVNADEIAIAQEQCPALFPQTKGILEFFASKEDELLAIGQFDIVVLVDAMEHVVSPPSMMRLAHRYVAPGGRFYFSNYGWYHHDGSHTALLPFANVFFSDETLINVIRWIVRQPSYQPSRYDSNPPVKRWEGIYNLRDRPGEHLNKITIREIKRLLRYSVFQENHLEIVGFKQFPLSLVNPLRHVPLLQELFHSYVVVECRK
jgi:2-polyprenyl-3-methyl-5-hydroxy-6-metoxy-1,4-benzoquinol methylase